MDEKEILKTLKELKTLLYDKSCSKCINQVKNKDIVLFMGNTRAGKSTIVNHVIGNPLKAEHINKNRYRINHATTEFNGPTIGIESISETTLPTVWTSNRISGLIVDAPGFDDNRGEAQDIANVFHIKNILTSAKSVKIVLILDINDIVQDNVGQFVSLIDKVKSMLPNITSIINPAITFVLNKDDNDTTKSEVCEYFQKKILTQSLLKVNNRELVEYLHNNQNQIVLVRMPESDRILNNDDELFDDLINTIENISCKVDNVHFSSVNFGLSDKSKAFLYLAHTRLSEHRDFENAFNNSVSFFTQRLHIYDQTFGDYNAGYILKNELQALDGRIQAKMNSNFNVYESIQAIYEIVPENNALCSDGEIYKKIHFIGFVDQILEINNHESIKGRVRTAFSQMKDVISQKSSVIQTRIEQLHHEEQERMRVVEEERIRRENEEIERLRLQQEEQQRELERLRAQQHRGRRRNDCVIQ